MKSKYLFQAATVTAVATAAILTQAPTADASFFDVKPNTESGNAIQKLVGLQITSGYADGTFMPRKNITRAEAAKILTALHLNGKELPQSASTFIDIPNNHWAKDYVAYANEQKWISGYGNGFFGTNDNLTRGQFAKILTQYMGETAPEIELSFSDVPAGSYFEAGVKFLVSNNITKGTSDSTFSPDTPITREQLAIFLDRAKLLEHAPEAPAEQLLNAGANQSLAQLANPNVTYNGDSIHNVLATLLSDVTQFYRVSNNAPLIDLVDNHIYYEYAGNFAYSITIHTNGKYEDYVLLARFTETETTSFKIFKKQQFEQYVTSMSSGSNDLKHYVNATLAKYPTYRTEYELQYMGMVSGELPLSGEGRYFEFYEDGPTVIQVQYRDNDSFDIFFEFYALTGTWNGTIYEYTTKKLAPIETLTFSSQYLSPSLYSEINGKSYRTIYNLNEDGSVSIYAADERYTPINSNMKFKVILYDSNLDTYIEKYYKYDGQKFVEIK